MIAFVFNLQRQSTFLLVALNYCIDDERATPCVKFERADIRHPKKQNAFVIA